MMVKAVGQDDKVDVNSPPASIQLRVASLTTVRSSTLKHACQHTHKIHIDIHAKQRCTLANHFFSG